VGADDVVVAVITGNGLKTIEDHPAKPWPSMVSCQVDAMRAALDELREAAAAGVGA
jgi:hypothetical protein